MLRTFVFHDFVRLLLAACRTNGNFPRRSPTRDLHVAFKILCIQDFVTKLSRQQEEIVQNHENVNVRNTGQSEA
jgi:hypothetical protein